MIRVKIQTDENTFIVDDCTCYLHGIETVAEALGYMPKINRICHLDEYDEEMEIVEFYDELESSTTTQTTEVQNEP